MNGLTYRCSAHGHILVPVKNHLGEELIDDCRTDGSPPVEISQSQAYAINYVEQVGGARPGNFNDEGYWPGVTLSELEIAWLWCRSWGTTAQPAPATGKNPLFE